MVTQMTFRDLIAAATLCVALTAGTARAETYRLSTWAEINHTFTIFGHTEWIDRVKDASAGEITFEPFYGGALLPAKATMQGIASGVAQVGLISAAYDPSNLPVSNAIDAHGFLTPDPFVMQFAFTDFIMNDSAGYDDWRKNGVVFGAGYSTPNYHFICREPYGTLAELRGKRVRVPGGGWARFTQSIGMTGVNLTGAEMYAALERGAVDCIAGDLTTLTGGARLIEITGGVTLVNMSPGYSGALNAYNPDFWRSLTDDQRRMLLNESARSMVRLQQAFARQEQEAIEAAQAQGIEIVEADDTLRAAYQEWVGDGIGGALQVAGDSYQIEDPDALFETFSGYVEKWESLLASLPDRTDEEAMTALVRENLFDKVDVSTYGMEE